MKGIRKKIWQIPGSYHCSIIGICLSRKDLRQLSTKKNFDLHGSMTDYAVHNMLSSLVKVKSQQSRVLHKILDTKYRLSIKKYSVLQLSSELLEQWEKDSASGSVAGAYWAVMTHPMTDNSVLNRVYGDCHMQSFDCFSQLRVENRTLDRLQKNNALLQGQLDLSQREKKQLKEQCQADSRKCVQMSDELAEVKRLNAVLERQQVLPQRRSGDETKRKLEKARLHITRLKGELKTLFDEKGRVEQMLDSAVNLITQQEMKIEALTGQLVQPQEQLELDEETALQCFQEAEGCSACGDDCSCPLNRQLCGKRVLYVGGHHKMIPRYRQVIEEHGAEFLYHDGGRESSRHILPKLLNGADAVVCPVDCVSHDACKCVKKICKRDRKPFVMMRSSGVSSLSKSLSEIQQ